MPKSRASSQTPPPEGATARVPARWPSWWSWDLVLTPHVERRMVDRNFTEVELRRMLEQASSYRPDGVEGRWVIQTKHQRKRWEVIVEPEEIETILIVVTAYPAEARR
ncbi:DUF4258 domain-containing protein [Polyangium aurulentum]|uniref:DUF4258 domain-containing protein n=1 Tax=Polyangium aurulentum TaxID=2567896 RepID=UPI00200D12E2|nr:DUF4258 domain-containing protein [Polyangium aurulentum]UQA60938.1 DUF4258 domain-containing protein [Polyangium aurulentum]